MIFFLPVPDPLNPLNPLNPPRSETRDNGATVMEEMLDSLTY